MSPGLFGSGGLKLPSAQERAQTALRRDLESRRDFWDRPGYHYRGVADLLLQRGLSLPGRVLPPEYEPLRGEGSACFLNALAAAQQDPTLRYMEGRYTCGYGSPRSHAWCIDENDELVEVTMPTSGDELAQYNTMAGLPYMPVEHWGYIGVVLTVELVAEHLDKLGLPIFDRSTSDIKECVRTGLDPSSDHDFPLLKVPYTSKRKELP
jgi:hypothetical protein